MQSDNRPLRYLCDDIFNMKLYRRYILYINICLGLLISPFCSSNAEAKDFVVVIDAGHGGHDPGAVGKISKEKNINLNVALKLGKQIQKNCPDVKVVYTRTRDVFIPLDRRAEIANNAKADLFISIHTNALAKNRTAKGASTWTLGLAKSDANLEVAKRENSVILYESDYKTRYAGFNPNSAESYIIFEFMQNKHMEQSISLASEVQKCFASAKRNNRGVRQAGFLVLRKTSMPSILVELGYISNPAEERFMRTKEGQNKLATAIYNAFTKYKWEYDRKRGALAGNASAAPILEVADNIDDNQPISAPPGSEEYIRQKNKMEESNQSRVSKSAVSAKQAGRVKKGQTIYKIQILTSDKKLSSGSKLFKGYKNVDYFIEKGIYKYTYGETTSFDSIRKLRRQVAKDFKDAFIVAFKDGKKVKY